jgi:hypothetical protein
MKILISIIAIFLFSIAGCDKGIEPIPFEGAGFSGTITFVGAWPDSITRTHIIVFKNPLDSITDFNIFNLSYVSLEIPFGTRRYNFSSLDSAYVPISGHLSAGTYSYVCVAMSISQNLSFLRKDWFVAGLYYANSDTTKPGILTIPENTLVRNINIVCDFNHLPQQPPGGN